MGLYTLSFKVDKNSVALIYLSEIYHIDLTTLCLLYDKLGEDVFYFFYLFGGCQVGFPKSGKLFKILKFGQSYCQLKSRNQPLEKLATSQQEKKVLDKLNSLYDSQSRLFKMKIEVSNPESTDVIVRSETIKAPELGQTESSPDSSEDSNPDEEFQEPPLEGLETAELEDDDAINQ